MELTKVKDIFDPRLSPCMITDTEDYPFCYDPTSILSQDPLTLFEESLPKFMRRPAEWPPTETSDDWVRVIGEDTVPDDKFPSSKCPPELLSQDELWSPRTSPLSSPMSPCSAPVSPLRFSHDEESMDITTYVGSSATGGTANDNDASAGAAGVTDGGELLVDEDEEEGGTGAADIVDVTGSPSSPLLFPHDGHRRHHKQHQHHHRPHHLSKKAGGGGGRGRKRRPQEAGTPSSPVSKKSVRKNSKKRKGKPGRPRKSPNVVNNVKGKKQNNLEKLKSPKTTKRKVRQSGILHRPSKRVLIVEGPSSPPPSLLSPPITPPPLTSCSSFPSPIITSSYSLLTSSPSSPSSSSSSSSSTSGSGVTLVTATHPSMIGSWSPSADDRSLSLSEKSKRRKCMSHNEKAVHNELERRRRAQMSELLSELRVVIDTVKDDPKASQKRIVDEALRCIKQAKMEEKEMLAREKMVRSENEALKAKLRELSSQWQDVHGHSKVVIYRDTDEDDECSVVEIM